MPPLKIPSRCDRIGNKRPCYIRKYGPAYYSNLISAVKSDRFPDDPVTSYIDVTATLGPVCRAPPGGSILTPFGYDIDPTIIYTQNGSFGVHMNALSIRSSARRGRARCLRRRGRTAWLRVGNANSDDIALRGRACRKQDLGRREAQGWKRRSAVRGSVPHVECKQILHEIVINYGTSCLNYIIDISNIIIAYISDIKLSSPILQFNSSFLSF